MHYAARYYISTGALNCFYTLRQTWTEPTSYSPGDGLPAEIGSVTRDYHVRNLSTDRAEAITKAREITGKDLSAEFDVVPIGERRAIDWSVLQSGKYAGRSIHEVAETDRGYLIWLSENMAGTSAYGESVALAAAFLGRELAERAAARDKKAARKARNKSRAARVLARAAAMMKDLSNGAGDFCASIADTLKGGDLPAGRGYTITLDILAKTHGRRNSKAYNTAYNCHARAFEVASRLTA